MSKISELSDGGSLLPTDFLIAVRSGGNVKVQADQTEFDRIRLGDNEKIELGNSQDLQIYHDGSASYIDDAGTGNLRVRANSSLSIQKYTGETMGVFTADGSVLLAYDNATKFETTSTGISISDDANFPDNGKAIFGAGSDLQIYHDGSNSYVTDAGTGDLRLSGNNLRMQNADNSANYIKANNGSNVELYFNNSAKLATTNTGIDVTGTVTADGLTVSDGTETTSIPATADRLSFTGASLNYIQSAGSLFVQPTGDLVLNGSGAEIMRLKSGNVGIGTSSPSAKLDVAGTVNAYGNGGVALQWGDTSALGSLSFDGSANPVIRSAASKPLVFQTNGANERMRIDSSGNVGIGVTPTAKFHVKASANTYAGGFRLEGVDETTALGIAHVNGDNYFSGNATDDHLVLTGSGNVGIGTDSPSSGVNLDIQDSSQAVVKVGDGSTVDMRMVADVASGVGSIRTSGSTAVMAMYTASTERLRIDSSGNLLVASTDTDPSANNAGSTADNGVAITALGEVRAARYLATANSGAVGFFNRTGADGDILRLRKDGTTVGSIGAKDGDMTIGTGDVGFRFYDDGDSIYPAQGSTGAGRDAAVSLGRSTFRFTDAYLSGGVYLGGTAAANKLSDFETGSWTPTVTGSTTAGSYSNVSSAATYTKVGNLVTASMFFYGASGTGAGDLLIGGLPFSMSATANAVGVIQANSGLVYPASTNEAVFQMLANSTTGEVRCNKTDGSTYAKMQYPTTAGYIRISITYQEG